ncbi:MAG: phosphatidate cytidylyltransferase [Rhodothermales bacterium]|nr:phosphatidate cytidylyltransferase [Rhodothermales bacterium]MBO6780576.1 phosphatidate cytidylyltransferase [Rhodothermales bacterium]
MKRIVTALIGIPLFVALTWLGGWPFVGFIAVIALAGQKEAFALFSEEGSPPGNLPAYLAGLSMIFAPAWPPAIWLIPPLIILSLTWYLNRAQGPLWLSTLSGSLFGIIYPCAFLAALVVIRIPHSPVAWDPFPVTMGLVILMWVGDTAAYYAGRAFGKRALAPTLSPKKTWEGAIGGALGAFITAGVLSTVWSGGLAYPHWLALAAIVSVLGPAGDLFESGFKRASNRKDSASILPGHGGVLDRFDALMFVAPVAAAYLFTLAR